LVSYTLLRNDAAWLEPFVRHHCAILSGMVFIDDRSTDDTLRILASLQREGLPVLLLPSAGAEPVWEVGRQLERVWNESPVDLILPLEVNEYLVSTGTQWSAQELVTDNNVSVVAIPCFIRGFPEQVAYNEASPVGLRQIISHAGIVAETAIPGWRIVGIPPVSAEEYLLKSCVYTLDGIAGRRATYGHFPLWRAAYEKFKADPLDREIILPPQDDLRAELGLSRLERRYSPEANHTLELMPEILAFCEHFAETYRRRTLQKWPELALQARLQEVEREIGILQRSRSWQLTRWLRELAVLR
jgi:hypothetical protein